MWPDLSREYGTVPEGGDAKGAYQAGVWRALREADIRVKGTVGISADVLNGAFICMDDFEKAECIWENISYPRVMGVDDGLTKHLRKLSLKDVSSLVSPDARELIVGAIRVLRDGGLGIAPLRVLTGDVVDEEEIRNSDREPYATTYSTSGRHLPIANVREAPKDTVMDLLMASAYLIGLHRERPGGKYYMDDGGINNVLVDALLGRGYKDVIILRIYGYGADTEKRLEVPGGINLYHVAPRRDLGGLLGFDRRWVGRNMLLGYFDGECILYDLAGYVYHIDAPEGESYYLDKMMSKIQDLPFHMRPELETAGEAKVGRKVQEKIIAGHHVYTEQVFPRLAKELKLKEGQDYKKLYLSILEDLARQYRTSRFRIYTVEEFLRLIHKKAGTAALKATIPILDSDTQVQYIMHKDAQI